ncbi:MAG: 30S ribosomal protein S12 methylthiotransferase RimO [Treponema sp.]|nr:30S ribosomal protein S12 methylthiotransferase RimO [Treponema sp.]
MTDKTFFLDQHGCAKNQVDGELIISRLSSMGMKRTEDASEADLIIINSCGFIESAKKESLDALMDARDAYPHAKILLAGCLAERYADVFKTELPEADGIFGNGDLSLIENTVSSLFNGERPVVRPPQKGVCCGDRNFLLSFKGSAFVKITEGCDNRCTFCAIPIIRGALRSRNADEIVSEIESLVAKGIHEINLIGQDLAAYGCGADDDVFCRGENWYDSMYHHLSKPVIEDPSFAGGKQSLLAELVSKISLLKGNFWVRLLYIHPDHFNPDILSVMKKDPRFLPYFDIPFQSGDDGVIRLMNRKGSFDSYVNLIKAIRAEFPESCIRTTFLTGFPGETEEAAEKTVKFLQTIQSDWSGCFPYSREEGTPADKMKGRVPRKVAEKRASLLESIQSEITANRLKSRVGKEYEVLIEEIVQNPEETDEGLAIGRAWFEAPEVDGNVVVRYDLDDADAVSAVIPGALVKVRALASSAVDIDGEYVGL